MFNFKRIEEDDLGFTVELSIDCFSYTIFWSSWGVFSCTGNAFESHPLEAVYFDPV